MAFIQELKNDFKKLIASGKLSHSYLFFGASIDAQYNFARELACFLETVDWRKPEKPLVDSFFVEEEAPGIDTARDIIIKFLWQKPVRSKRRILIVKNAQQLTAHAQNAILKISEEPPENALIILTAKDPNVLLPTLSSRFQKIYISGEAEPLKSPELEKLARQVLRAPAPKQRTELIKKILDEETNLNDFVTVLISYLHKDLMRNWRIIKEVLHRWRMINQFNVNKRLQLEVSLANYHEFSTKNH